MVVLLIVAALQRLATEPAPPLVIHRALSAYVRLAGDAPVLAWPREGEAAIAVQGVGALGSSGAQTPVPIASVAKVMTAYLTLLEHPLGVSKQGFELTITHADVEEQGRRVALGESTVPVRTGERLSERQALEALLLPSANNIAALLAVHDAGSQGSFVARMNAMARKLGMLSTIYTDPSGFDEGTVSTAADQLKMARAAMSLPALAAIVQKPSARLPVVGSVVNYNGLVGTSGYVGIKTGSDHAAGGCLMFAKRVTVAGRRLMVLGVVLGQRTGSLIDAALASSERLGNSAASALRVLTVLPAGVSVLDASSADGRRTTAAILTPLREVGWGGLTLAVHVVLRPRMTRLRAGEPMASISSGLSALLRRGPPTRLEARRLGGA